MGYLFTSVVVPFSQKANNHNHAATVITTLIPTTPASLGLAPTPVGFPVGVLPEGVVPDGVVPDGVVPDGVVPDGVVPDGVVPLGVFPGELMLGAGMVVVFTQTVKLPTVITFVQVVVLLGVVTLLGVVEFSEVMFLQTVVVSPEVVFSMVSQPCGSVFVVIANKYASGFD